MLRPEGGGWKILLSRGGICRTRDSRLARPGSLDGVDTMTLSSRSFGAGSLNFGEGDSCGLAGSD